MNVPELDYRFGWRWLLPLMDGDKVFLQGFSEEEEIFWRNVLWSGSVTVDAAEATVLIVSEVSPPLPPHNIKFPHIRSLCVVGSSPIVNTWRCWLADSFSDLKEYSLIPSTSPRLVVPLDNAKCIVKALRLHQPGRLIPRLGVSLVRILARFGIKLAPLRLRMLFIASKDYGIPPQGARQAKLDLNSSGRSVNFALYIGSLGLDRKTVILPLEDMPGTILKHGSSVEAQAALQNESNALRAMSLTPLAMHVPALFNMTVACGQTTLHQEYRPRKPMAASSLKSFAAQFLGKLSREGLKLRPLKEVLMEYSLMTSSEARERGQPAYAQILEILNMQAASRVMVLGHRSHGDFAPWNCSWTAKGFFVFDWEHSLSWDVALGDAFYFVLSTYVAANRLPNLAIVESDALTLASTVVYHAKLESSEIKLYWAIWLLRRMNQKPTVLYEKLLERLARSFLKN